MLEKITKEHEILYDKMEKQLGATPNGHNGIVNDELGTMQFAKIRWAMRGNGFVFVRDAAYKHSKRGTPYIVLYVADTEGVVIPAYLFDVGEVDTIGADMAALVGSIVKIAWEENYLEGSGLTLRISSVLKVTNPTAEMLSRFVGTVEQIEEHVSAIERRYTEVTGHKVKLPYGVRTFTSVEYESGKVGGIVTHYRRLLGMLDALEGSMSKEDFTVLYNTAILFVFAHYHYVEADKNGGANITLVSELFASIQKVARRLELTDGVSEVVHVMFGYSPKDINVRIIKQLNDTLMQVAKEISVWRALPIGTDGNAGYGTIHHYDKMNGAV